MRPTAPQGFFYLLGPLQGKRSGPLPTTHFSFRRTAKLLHPEGHFTPVFIPFAAETYQPGLMRRASVFRWRSGVSLQCGAEARSRNARDGVPFTNQGGSRNAR